MQYMSNPSHKKTPIHQVHRLYEGSWSRFQLTSVREAAYTLDGPSQDRHVETSHTPSHTPSHMSSLSSLK